MKKLTGMMAMLLAAIMVCAMNVTAIAEDVTTEASAPIAVEQPAPAPQPEQPAKEQPAKEQPAETEQPKAEPTDAETTETAAPAETAEVTQGAADETAAPETEPEAATPTAEPETTPADAQQNPAPENVTVTTRCIAGANLQYGDSVTVIANVQGLDQAAYRLQWQYNDGAGWKDCNGANGDSYSFTLTRENAGYLWRAMVTVE